MPPSSVVCTEIVRRECQNTQSQRALLFKLVDEQYAIFFGSTLSKNVLQDFMV